jgi:hypothetical protein
MALDIKKGRVICGLSSLVFSLHRRVQLFMKGYDRVCATELAHVYVLVIDYNIWFLRNILLKVLINYLNLFINVVIRKISRF